MRRTKPAPDDWRSDAERVFDARLLGVWWRCIRHGLLTTCIPLGGFAYCPFEECDEQLLVVSQPDGKERGDWRKSGDPANAPEHRVLARDPHDELPVEPTPPVGDRGAPPAPAVDQAWLEQARRRYHQVLDGLAEEHPPAAAITALDQLLLEDLPRLLASTSTTRRG